MNQRLSPKLRTTYRVGFLKKKGSPPKPFSYINELIPSIQKMELKTTKQEDFREYERVEASDFRRNRHRSVSPFKFNTTSTYSNTFLDFGPIQKLPSNIVSTPLEPIKFSTSSTYTENFKRHLKLPEIVSKTPKDSNVLGTTGISIMETTSQSTYKNYKDILESKPFIHGSNDHSIYSHSPCQTTTYASSFNSVSPKKPRIFMEQVENDMC
jgi:hypothetical protein